MAENKASTFLCKNVIVKLNLMIYYYFFLLLEPPFTPTDLKVTENGAVAEITWISSADERRATDFYIVEVYSPESDRPLYSSRVKDTHDHVVFLPTTVQLTVTVAAVNRCEQLSRRNASKRFSLKGKFFACSSVKKFTHG